MAVHTIEIPMNKDEIDFNRLENILSEKLAGNHLEDSCECTISNEQVVNSLKNYSINSYDFSVAISQKGKGEYLIKFSTSMQNA